MTDVRKKFTSSGWDALFPGGPLSPFSSFSLAEVGFFFPEDAGFALVSLAAVLLGAFDFAASDFDFGFDLGAVLADFLGGSSESSLFFCWLACLALRRGSAFFSSMEAEMEVSSESQSTRQTSVSHFK